LRRGYPAASRRLREDRLVEPLVGVVQPRRAGVARILEGAPLGFRLRRVPRVEPGAVATELTDHVTHEEVREGLKQRSIEPLRFEDVDAPDLGVAP
jgi:hypothetical protein